MIVWPAHCATSLQHQDQLKSLGTIKESRKQDVTRAGEARAKEWKSHRVRSTFWESAAGIDAENANPAQGRRADPEIEFCERPSHKPEELASRTVSRVGGVQGRVGWHHAILDELQRKARPLSRACSRSRDDAPNPRVYKHSAPPPLQTPAKREGFLEEKTIGGTSSAGISGRMARQVPRLRR